MRFLTFLLAAAASASPRLPTLSKLGARLKRRAKGPATGSKPTDAGALRRENAATIKTVLGLLDDTDPKWQSVVSEGRTKVWRRDGVGRHACVLAKGVLDAPPDAVYDLFADATRAREFNEFCVERLGPDTKVSWSATKNFGPFKPRDFVTLCHYTRLPGGARVIVNRPTRHASRPVTSKYRRAEVVLAANVVEPAPGGRTRLTLVTQVNPKGAVDSAVGARIANALVVRSPGAFFDAIEKAANKKRAR